jgi:hypothetical protein
MARRRLRARVNWAMRWGGAAVCAAILMIYMVSSLHAADVQYSGKLHKIGVQLWRGQVTLLKIDWPSPMTGRPTLRLYTSTRTEMEKAGMTWPRALWFQFEHPPLAPAQTVLIAVPLWAPMLLLAWASAGSWRVVISRGPDERPCASCGYDLSGLPPGSACPECAAVQKG